jgi:hypothetical protein
LGLTITSTTTQAAGRSGFGSTKDNYTVYFREVPDYLIIRNKHRNLRPPRDRRWFKWNIESVRRTEQVEEVFCPTVEGRHVVAIATPGVPLLTGQSMHFEINANLAKVEEVWRKLKKPLPAPPPASDVKIERVLKLTDPHMQGEDVRFLQALLNRMFPAYSDLAVDGDFGPATEKVVKEFQRRSNLTSDGEVGPQTRRALGL